MKKWLILALALFCVACTPQSKITSHIIGEQVTLVKTVDGDTAQLKIKNKTERVRFLIIDTPESVKENTPVQPYGKEASERVKTLLTNAKTISLEYETGQERDNYDRVLAYVYIDGELLQNILVKEGLARVAYYKGNEKYLEQLLQTQKRAESQKIGIWSINGYVTKKGFKE